ncbi:P-loop containing nucleoside triphosphate hydrolase protein [Amanita muscaria]
MAPPNVIIFGETGGGKSSIINLLAGANVAATSSGSVGCTFRSNAYNVSIEGMTFRFHDTAGLDEGQGGTVVKQQAIVQLYELLRSLSDGVSLLIFCMRGPRIKESVVRNWQLFWDIICQKHVPILLAITGLENEQDMDAWWKNNQTFFTRNLMNPKSVACITAAKGKKRRDGSHNFDHEYVASREKMNKAIKASYRREGWKVQRTEWFKTIVETSYKSGKGGATEVKTNKTVFGSATNELIKRKLMKREEAEELARLLMDR